MSQSHNKAAKDATAGSVGMIARFNALATVEAVQNVVVPCHGQIYSKVN